MSRNTQQEGWGEQGGEGCRKQDYSRGAARNLIARRKQQQQRGGEEKREKGGRHCAFLILRQNFPSSGQQKQNGKKRKGDELAKARAGCGTKEVIKGLKKHLEKGHLWGGFGLLGKCRGGKS